MKLQFRIGESILSGKQLLELDHDDVLALNTESGEHVDIVLNNRLFASGSIGVRNDQYVIEVQNTFGHATMLDLPTLYSVAEAAFETERQEEDEETEQEGEIKAIDPESGEELLQDFDEKFVLLTPDPPVVGFLSFVTDEEGPEHIQYEEIEDMEQYPIESRILADEDELISWLKDAGIQFLPDAESKIRSTFSIENLQDNRGEKIEIARGIDPVPGKNADIRWEDHLMEYFNMEEKREQLEDKKTMDQSNTENLQTEEVKLQFPYLHIPKIHAGDQICELIPPEPGDPGVDIFGNEAPPKQAEDQSVSPGQNVESRTVDNHQIYVSQLDGHVEYESSEGVISVQSEYTIRDRIPAIQDTIHYPGTLITRDRISDGVTIETEKGFQAKGETLGAAKVQSGGPIKINEGIAGRGECQLESDKAIETKYVNEATLKAPHVKIKGEIFNTTIECEELDNKKGQIVGGEIIVMRRGEIGEIGSEMGVDTQLKIGIKPGANQRIKEIQEKLPEISEEMNRVKSAAGEEHLEMEKEELYEETPEDQHEFYENAIEKYETLKEEKRALRSELRELQRMTGEQLWEEITIKKRIYPGVKIQMGKTKRSFHDEVQGPMKLVLDEESNRITKSQT